MELRRLGNSGLLVSALSFGAMTFGGEGMFAMVGTTAEAEAERLIGLCLDAGVNLFDTADAYSNGRSEEILAHALGKKRQDVVIATKAWGRTGPGPNDVGGSRLHLVQACEASLRRLKTDYIDLYQLHGFDALTPLDETLAAFDDLVRAGKVRYVGCSNYAGWQLMKALAVSDRGNLARYISHQLYYSLVGRDAEHELLPLGIDQGVGSLIWSPLAFGILSGKFRRGQANPEGTRGTLAGVPGGTIDRAKLDDITDALAGIAEARGATMAQVALNWLLRKKGVTSVILGARNEAQLADNLAAASWTLSDDELARLDAASATPLPYPGWAQRGPFAERNPKSSARGPQKALAPAFAKRQSIPQANLHTRVCMRIGTWGVLLLIAPVLSLVFALQNVWAASMPPVEAYGMLPAIEAPRLSPDGTMMASISSVQGRRCLVIQHLEVKQNPSIICPGQDEVRYFVWKTDKRILLSVYESTGFRSATLVTASALLGVDINGSNVKQLLSPRQGRMINFNTDSVLDLLDGDPDHVLMTVNTSYVMFPDVIKVDVNTGETETVISARDDILRWLTDAQGNPRLGMALSSHKIQFLYRDSADSGFTKIEGTDIIGESGFAPLGFSDQPGVIYVSSNHETGRNCVYLYDVKNKKILDRIASNPDADIQALIWRNKRVVGYVYSDDQPRQVFTDPGWKHDAELIAKNVPNSSVVLVDRTDDGRRVLARVTVGNQPATYFVLARIPGQNTELDPVGKERPYIPEDSVAPVKPVVYRARDGLQIHAFLTMPRGVSKGPIPFVVLPHGGPWDRDYFRFDYLAQMIASRGYGVLQPNFRGSTGYGVAFLAAGFQEWGRKMQDDVTDGTRWLIDQKLADPARLCIVGWSYGGYAALMGAIKEPSLYRCVASMAGVTDLRRIQPRIAASLGNFAAPTLVGDMALIDENSPMKNADKINIPVLLAHGRQDVNVPVRDTEQMESALKSAGKRVDAIYFDADDHYLFKEGDRVAFLKKLETFLRDNLGPATTN